MIKGWNKKMFSRPDYELGPTPQEILDPPLVILKEK